jgi:His/Glu/Gln/Arg/opine family amino acid ABC transporter permease subunit
MTFDLGVLSGYGPELVQGLGGTIWLCTAGAAMSGVLGVLLTIGQRRGAPWLVALIRGYTALTLGLPLLVLLYVTFFVLPDFGVLLPAPLVGTVTLAIYYGPYVAEVIQAAVAAVPAGTVEAGVAIGMSPAKIAASAAAVTSHADRPVDRSGQGFRAAVRDLGS